MPLTARWSPDWYTRTWHIFAGVCPLAGRPSQDQPGCPSLFKERGFFAQNGSYILHVARLRGRGAIACLPLHALNPVLQAKTPLPKGPGNLSSTVPASRSPGGLPKVVTSLPANRPGTFPASDVVKLWGILACAEVERMLRSWFE